MNSDKRKDQLYDEQFDTEWDLYEKLGTLIDASWDSNTVKLQIEKLYKQYRNIRNEIWEIEQTEDHSHPELKEETNQ